MAQLHSKRIVLSYKNCVPVEVLKVTWKFQAYTTGNEIYQYEK